MQMWDHLLCQPPPCPPQSSSRCLAMTPLHPSCPPPPLLLVWMSVSSLTPWLLDFRTVQFPGSSGYFLFVNLLLSCFGCARRQSVYLCLHLARKSTWMWFFNSVVVGLPLNSISDGSERWLFCILGVILMWLCEEASCVYWCRLLNWKSGSFSLSPIISEVLFFGFGVLQFHYGVSGYGFMLNYSSHDIRGFLSCKYLKFSKLFLKIVINYT